MIAGSAPEALQGEALRPLPFQPRRDVRGVPDCLDTARQSFAYLTSRWPGGGAIAVAFMFPFMANKTAWPSREEARTLYSSLAWGLESGSDEAF